MSLTPHAIGDVMVTGGPVDLCCPEGQKDTRDPLIIEGRGWDGLLHQKNKKKVLYCDLKAVSYFCHDFLLLQKFGEVDPSF